MGIFFIVIVRNPSLLENCVRGLKFFVKKFDTLLLNNS
jgi:hypothetical protein